MKKGFVLVLVVCSITLPIVMSSCTTISRTGQAAPFAYTEVHPYKIKAEMDFNLEQKSTGKASAWYALWFWKVAGSSKFAEVKGSETQSGLFGNRVAQVKSAAIYNALGSSDMEPNDQYLCIVPDSRQKSYMENIFLPFEGDNGLSILLSKAFLLADDDKITDATITSQIKNKREI
jgi:hypothetical protein